MQVPEFRLPGLDVKNEGIEFKEFGCTVLYGSEFSV